MALDNHKAIVTFFNKFVEYRNNEFFIAGESYAGMYVPTLSDLVIDNEEINFQVGSLNKLLESLSISIFML